jgi:hypothetical protein
MAIAGIKINSKDIFTNVPRPDLETVFWREVLLFCEGINFPSFQKENIIAGFRVRRHAKEGLIDAERRPKKGATNMNLLFCLHYGSMHKTLSGQAERFAIIHILPSHVESNVSRI